MQFSGLEPATRIIDIGEEQWKSHKPLILELLIGQQFSLTEIQNQLAYCDIAVSLRMLKWRLKQWGVYRTLHFARLRDAESDLVYASYYCRDGHNDNSSLVRKCTPEYGLVQRCEMGKCGLQKADSDEHEAALSTEPIASRRGQHKASGDKHISHDEGMARGGLNQDSTGYNTSGPIQSGTPSGQLLSNTQRMEAPVMEHGFISNPGFHKNVTKSRHSEQFKLWEDRTRQTELTILFLDENGADKCTFINATVKSLSLSSLENVMRDEALKSIVPCTSTSWLVPTSVRNGHGAFYNDNSKLPTSGQPSSHHQQHVPLLPGTDRYAKRTDCGDITAQKPQPPPARMSPDDDDDDESYGFRRAQPRLANRQNEEWRAVIARVCDPFSRATEHEMGRLCKGTSVSGGRVTRLPLSAESNAVETY